MVLIDQIWEVYTWRVAKTTKYHILNLILNYVYATKVTIEDKSIFVTYRVFFFTGPPLKMIKCQITL